MSLYRFTTPPRTLRRSVHLGNLALVPASLLPYKKHWQQIANDLPEGNILVILPNTDRPLRRTVETVATLLETDGHRVTTLPAEQFL